MADPVGGIKYDPADMTDPNNPLARYHTEGKIAAAMANMGEQRITEDEWQYILTEGKIAAAMADMEARAAAQERAAKEAQQFSQQKKVQAAVQGVPNQDLFSQGLAPNK